MRIAVAVDGDRIAEHFGRCERYDLFSIADGQIVAQRQMDCPEHEPGLLPELLVEQSVDTIIAGGIGMKARAILSQHKVRVISGVSGSIGEAVQQFIAGTLSAGDDLCTQRRCADDCE